MRTIVLLAAVAACILSRPVENSREGCKKCNSQITGVMIVKGKSTDKAMGPKISRLMKKLCVIVRASGIKCEIADMKNRLTNLLKAEVMNEILSNMLILSTRLFQQDSTGYPTVVNENATSTT